MEALTEWLPVIGLYMLRPLGVMLMVPLFSQAALGGTLVRNSLVLMIALPLIPLHDTWPSLEAARHNATAGHYLVLIAGELSIGLLMGFCAAIPFWAMDMAGFLIDTLRGASIASIINPLLGQESSLFGILFTQIFGVLFLVSGGFNQLIAGIYHSYTVLPPGEVFHFGPGFLEFLSRQWQLTYELCLRFAMPAIVAILLVDMALGLVNRSAQQLNVFFLSMPIKSAFALLMLAMSLEFAFNAPLEQSQHWVQHVLTLMDHLR
ncbi:type III secretion system export apparatus subunit SctT [Pseudomonas sp. TH31]|uniref:type III secretion system export apparatus subunit SctT n=1 Tax=Pseudomonas sp. TH31 TaxID=2796396 RepID=UPI0019135F36|nr:type III secretion system export apparatus subunit SctT [Pseudomonas sp. TH31]